MNVNNPKVRDLADIVVRVHSKRGIGDTEIKGPLLTLFYVGISRYSLDVFARTSEVHDKDLDAYGMLSLVATTVGFMRLSDYEIAFSDQSYEFNGESLLEDALQVVGKFMNEDPSEAAFQKLLTTWEAMEAKYELDCDNVLLEIKEESSPPPGKPPFMIGLN